MEDKDLPSSVWNNYIKKYRNQYRIAKDRAGVWVIRCKYGNIQPYSLKNKELCFVGDFRSPRALTGFLRKTEGLECYNSQGGSEDVVVVFNEDLLPQFVKPCSIRIKRHVQMSDERKQQLREQLRKARVKKNGSV